MGVREAPFIRGGFNACQDTEKKTEKSWRSFQGPQGRKIAAARATSSGGNPAKTAFSAVAMQNSAVALLRRRFRRHNGKKALMMIRKFIESLTNVRDDCGHICGLAAEPFPPIEQRKVIGHGEG